VAEKKKGGGGAKDAKRDDGEKIVVRNRKAFHDFEVLEQIEAGLVLKGTEVKSLRAGNLQLGDAYARFVAGELHLVNAHIPEYKMGGWTNHEPTRPRKLLLHKREVARLSAKVEEKGLTLVPLAVYFKRGYAKVRLGVCRGKKLYDKRASIAKRDVERSARREAAAE
jgi:SsrA-binding protein